MSVDSFLDRWTRIPVRARGLALMGVLTVLLVGMAANEHVRRLTGQEIILAAHPVDPRDVLRGAYVSIDYDIERIYTPGLAAPPRVSDFKRSDDVWLVLRRGGQVWTVTRLLAARPRDLGPSEVALRARLLDRAAFTAPQPREGPAIPDYASVEIGADRYFADEARAKALEASIRNGAFEVVLSVGSEGRPVIKGLVLDGVRSDESFF